MPGSRGRLDDGDLVPLSSDQGRDPVVRRLKDVGVGVRRLLPPVGGLATQILHLRVKDPRFWPAVGVALDVLLLHEGRLGETAVALGTTTANLGDFLRIDEKVWEQANLMRIHFGHKPLR